MRKYYLCNKGRPEFCSGLVWMFLSGMFCRFMKMMTDEEGNPGVWDVVHPTKGRKQFWKETQK